METVQNFFLSLATFLNSLFGIPSQPVSQPSPQVTAVPPSTFSQYLHLEKSVRQKLDDLIVEMNGQVDYQVSERTGKLTFLKGIDRTIPVHQTEPSGITVELIARRFLAEYGSLFGLKSQQDELELLRIDGGVVSEDLAAVPETIRLGYFDPTGMSHVRFRQIYQGVPVFGGQIIVHITSRGGIAYVNGQIIPGINLSVRPSLSAQQAEDIIKQQWARQFNSENISVETAQLYIFSPELFSSGGLSPILTWRVEGSSLGGQGQPQAHIFYINAHNGTVVGQMPAIAFSTKDPLNRQVYDCRGHWLDVCPSWPDNPTRKEKGTATGDEVIDNLYINLGKADSYFRQNFDRQGANNRGGTGNEKQPFSFFFTGTRAKTLPEISYGFYRPEWKGYPFAGKGGIFVGGNQVDLYTIAHEFTHLVTMFSVSGSCPETGLCAKEQWAAINEAIADIFASAILRVNNENVQFIFNFKDKPKKLFSNNYECDIEERLPIKAKKNSSIITYAYQLMIEGGNFNGCQIESVDELAVNRIFYKALTSCLTETTNFNSLYYCLTNQCEVLKERNLIRESVCQQITNALQAVEIDQQPAGYAINPLCLPEGDPGRVEEEKPGCAGEESIEGKKVAIFLRDSQTLGELESGGIYKENKEVNVCYTIPDAGKVVVYKRVETVSESTDEILKSSEDMGPISYCIFDQILFPAGEHDYWVEYIKEGDDDTQESHFQITVTGQGEECLSPNQCLTNCSIENRLYGLSCAEGTICCQSASSSQPEPSPTPTLSPTPLPPSDDLSIYLKDGQTEERLTEEDTYVVGRRIKLCWELPKHDISFGITKSIGTSQAEELFSCNENEEDCSNGCINGELSLPSGRHTYTITIGSGVKEQKDSFSINVKTQCEQQEGICIGGSDLESECIQKERKVNENPLGCTEYCCLPRTLQQPTATVSPTPTEAPIVVSTATPLPTSTPEEPIPTKTPIPLPATVCHQIFKVSITDMAGRDLGNKIPRGEDFLCKVTTDRVNYWTSCGLMLNNSWPLDICHYIPGRYGYQRWEGNTAVFKCNTKCALNSNCQGNNLPTGGNYEIIGFDFSPDCGPYTQYVKKMEVILE